MIPITRPDLPPLAEYVALLEQIWDSRMLSNFGPFSQQLEALTTAYLGVGTRVVVSGDIGLACAISALDLPPGSTCLVPSFTFNSTINAVLWNGLVPVFVDIDADSFNLDVAAASVAADECGPSLIIATHVFGNPADAEGLGRLAAECGARLLFDAAHGYGSRRDGVPVGQLGDVEVFSLSGTKPVTCAEGGLVTSRDAGFLERFVYARAYGFQADYNTRRLGLNGKMSELHAALGLLTLARIEEAVARRQVQVERYRSALASAPVRLQSVRDCDRSTYKDFAVVFDSGTERDAVEAALTTAGFQTKRYFRPCHTMDAYLPFAAQSLPVTEAIYERILCLPVFGQLPDAMIDRVCEIVLGALANESVPASR